MIERLFKDYTGEIKPDSYPKAWKEIATCIKEESCWKCERCKHENDRPSGHVLTVHHLDGNKANCVRWNLAALCQRCHLKIQARIVMEQLFFMDVLDVSEWFKPHLSGYLAAVAERKRQGDANLM